MRYWLCHLSPSSQLVKVYWLFGRRIGVLPSQRHLGYRLAIHVYPFGWCSGRYIKVWPLRLRLWP